MAASRAIVDQLKLQKLENVNKVSFHRGETEFAIQGDLEIYFNPATKTYVFFGEPRASNFALQAQQMLQMLQSSRDKLGVTDTAAPTADLGAEFTEEDISTVMGQGNVSRDKAVELLQKHGDVVNAVIASQE